MHLTPELRRLAAGLILLAGLAGCATTGGTAGTPDWAPLKMNVEALYLNYWDLKRLHGDLHTVALAHIESGGPQLDEIQDAARFVQQANLIAFYQWELLSIAEYIHERARDDYFTLRVRDLIDARDQSNDLVLSIKVYDAFIRDPQALALIGACMNRIEKHRGLYLQMAQELKRLRTGRAERDDPAEPNP
jgi:hypothetical protein